MLPLVSIIIPHFNGTCILNECLSSLKRTKYPNVEIIVVDNASTDDSVQFLQDRYPDVQMIRNMENTGFAEGCNRGILKAHGELVLILNNDTTHEPDWIERMVETLLADSRTAIIQPKIISHQNNQLFDYSGACGGFIDYFGYPFARGRLFDTIEKDKGQYDDTREIFWASGTAFLARKDIMVRAGLFDKVFFAHMEEIDLNWHVHLLGYNIVVEPKAVVYHHSGYTLKKESYKKKYLNHRNSLLMLMANYSAGNLLWILPIRLGLELIAFFVSALILDFKRSAAILHALFWVMGHLFYISKKRRWVKSHRVLSDQSIMRGMVCGPLPIGYFLFHKRFFYQWMNS